MTMDKKISHLWSSGVTECLVMAGQRNCEL